MIGPEYTTCVRADLENECVISDSYAEINGVRVQLLRQILDVREKAIREALIALGWTSPKETK